MACLTSPSVPVSWGELLDKITILEIKMERIQRPDALANVAREHQALSVAGGPVLQIPGIAALVVDLKHVNEALWEIEDAIREEEVAGTFEETFVELARSVYRRNDERALIKREINALLNSELVEEKSYAGFGAATSQELTPELIAEPVR
jgi:hypothetical protein